jgi:hypothetical protein
MPVEDKYVNGDIAARKVGNPAAISGAQALGFVQNFTVAAADDDNSRFRVGVALPAEAVITRIDIFNAAITGGTAYDVGVAAPGPGGATLVQNVFANDLDMSAAATVTPKNGMAALTTLAHRMRKLFEHAGHTNATKLASYDLVITGQTAGTAAGDICVVCEYLLG